MNNNFLNKYIRKFISVIYVSLFLFILIPNTIYAIAPTKPVKIGNVKAVTATPVVPKCGCEANTCSKACKFANSSENIKCVMQDSIYTSSINANTQNSWCQRLNRVLGDANGDGVIDSQDYFYYLRSVSGDIVPNNINADFDGDGHVSPIDRVIIIKAMNN